MSEKTPENTPENTPKRDPKVSRQQIYTLVVQVGRKSGDGLPRRASGAGLVCYSSGVDEAEAVREAVAILKQADMAPLDVTGYGTLAERLDGGEDIPDGERTLMERALSENAVIVAQVTPFYDDATDDDDAAGPRSAKSRPAPGKG